MKNKLLKIIISLMLSSSAVYATVFLNDNEELSNTAEFGSGDENMEEDSDDNNQGVGLAVYNNITKAKKSKKSKKSNLYAPKDSELQFSEFETQIVSSSITMPTSNDGSLSDLGTTIPTQRGDDRRSGIFKRNVWAAIAVVIFITLCYKAYQDIKLFINRKN